MKEIEDEVEDEDEGEDDDDDDNRSRGMHLVNFFLLLLFQVMIFMTNGILAGICIV